MSSAVEDAHFIVLPGGGYEVYAENEADPIVDWRVSSSPPLKGPASCLA
jgi:hypothetical protein